jgi:uncharacterized protein YcfL
MIDNFIKKCYYFFKVEGLNMKKLTYLVLLLSVFMFFGCEEAKEEKVEDKKEEQKVEIKGDYSLNEAFSFMGFQVTVKEPKGIVTIEKEMSANNGSKVIRVPVTVKNNNKEKAHISMFYYKFYNAKNNTLSSKGSYFNDSLDYGGDLEPGEKYDKYFYIPYEGSGKYIIEFNNFSVKKNIVIDVK